MSYARYVKTVGQIGVPNGIGTGVRFDSARTTSPDVTSNGTTNQFTFTKAGIWAGETAVQVVGAPAKGADWQALCTVGPGPSSTAVVYTAQIGYGPRVDSTLAFALTAVRPYVAGDTVAVNVLMNSPNGGTFNLTAASEQVHISFVYLGAS